MKSQKGGLFKNSKISFSSRGHVAIILVILLVAISACEKRGQAVYPQYPQPVQRQQMEVPIIVTASPQPTQMPQVTPTPSVQNKECRTECNSVLQTCRSKSQPPFSKCVDSARTQMKNCLTAAGDDAYCRLEYSKSRTICFNTFMAGCDILFNTCVSKC